VEYFLCEELADDNEQTIRKDFENVDWANVSSVTDFLRKTINELKKRGKQPFVIMDQNNILERYQMQDLETFQFLVKLKKIFGRYFVGASNNNGTMRQLHAMIAEEIYLPAHQIFANRKEALEYLNHVGYFSVVLSKPDPEEANIKKIEEYTRFNLLELMKLNESFTLSNNKTIDDNLNNDYHKERIIELTNSHEKFKKEFISNNLSISSDETK